MGLVLIYLQLILTPYANEWFSFNVNTIGIPNVCTAPWNLQHIKDLKMTEWSVETCSPILSSNKCCGDVNNWLIICLSTSWCLYTNQDFHSERQAIQEDANSTLYVCKGKAIPVQVWTGPEGSRMLRLPGFKTIGTWRPRLPPRKYSWYSFL